MSSSNNIEAFWHSVALDRGVPRRLNRFSVYEMNVRYGRSRHGKGMLLCSAIDHIASLPTAALYTFSREISYRGEYQRAPQALGKSVDLSREASQRPIACK